MRHYAPPGSTPESALLHVMNPPSAERNARKSKSNHQKASES
jgi:hypothetical protein